MTKPKRKPRGVVARFLAGEHVGNIAYSLPPKGWTLAKFDKVEAILRRELRRTSRVREAPRD